MNEQLLHLASPALYGWCYGLSVLSALLPWLNGEVVVLTLSTQASSFPALLGLVLMASAGQMTGKVVLYWSSRRALRAAGGRAGAKLDAWRQRLESRPLKALAVVLLSSAVGLPPFYLITILAGGLKIGFPRYLAVGTLGRLMRFGSLVFFPRLVLAAWR
jgi:membrane protein YqaA with SNARE-associated domain